MDALLRDLREPDTWKAALAELVGTLFLTLAALLAGTPYAVALTLAAFVYAIGHISGCHLNPAVTIGLLSARRLPVATGLLYVLAQVTGALLAWLPTSFAGTPAADYRAGGAFAEFFGIGFLMLTVIAVSDKHVPKSGSGVAIGAALAAGLLTTGGILNPAVAIGLNETFSAATWATVLGAIAFSALFRLYARESKQQDDVAEQDQDTARERSRGAPRGTDRKLRQAMAVSGTGRDPEPVSSARAAAADGGDDATIVPVLEERLTVEKRPAELGEVLVRKSVVEQPETVPVDLRREEVHVEERPVDERVVRAADELFRDEVIRVPVRGEQAVVTKDAVVTREVVLSKERQTESRQVAGTVRRERIMVDPDA